MSEPGAGHLCVPLTRPGPRYDFDSKTVLYNLQMARKIYLQDYSKNSMIGKPLTTVQRRSQLSVQPNLLLFPLPEVYVSLEPAGSLL